MNGLLNLIIILVASIGFLVLIAFLLDRRARKNGNLIFHEKQELLPAQGKKAYLFIVILLLGTALFIWGFNLSSGLLQIIAGIIIAGSLLLRFYWTFTNLLKESKK